MIFSGWRIRNILATLVLMAACAIAGGTALAATTPPLRIGSEISFAPYAEVDKQGKATGFAIDLFAAAARSAGLEVTFHPNHWNIVWDQLKNGEIDALPLVARVPEREGQVEFTKPHTFGYDSFFTRKDRAPIATIEQARLLNIIVLRSDAAHQQLAARGFAHQLVLVDDLADGFRLLAFGQHDALLAPRLQGAMQTDMLGLAGVISHGPLLSEYRREFCFAVRKGDTALRDRLDQALFNVKSSGEYDRLYRKWLGIYDPPRFTAKQVATGTALAAGLLGLLGLWTWTLRRQVAVRTRKLTAEIGAREKAERELRLRAAHDIQEAELRASESRFRLLASATFEGIAITEQGRVVDANEQLLDILGYTRAEVLGMKIADFVSPDDRERILKNIAEGVESIIEHSVLRKDGRRIVVEAHGQNFENGSGVRRITAIRDITGYKLVEESLRKSEEHFRSLVEQAADGIFVADSQGNYIDVNSAGCSMLGYSREEILKLTLKDILDPAEIPRLGPTVENLASGRVVVSDWHFLRKDGSTFLGEVRGRQLSNGNLQGILIDITERRQAEQALRESDQRKDEFLAMLAHELRNPLVPIRNAAHILGRLELEEPRVKWAQQVIETQVGRLSHMVDDLLDVSRIAHGKISLKLEDIELNSLLTQIMQSIVTLAEQKRHQLSISLPEHEVRLTGDSIRLSQTIFNLLDNAIKYTPDGGLIEFTARMVGEEVEIGVQDNGMGITAELLPKVFDLFQQDERGLDRAQGGLGIGLTLVQRLVVMHGGRVAAYSKGKGMGATFTVWLPAKATATQPAEKATMSKRIASQGRRVLVVDDDFAVADSMVMLMELEGYAVCMANSGAEALRQVPIFRPQAVLLDIGLHGMDGFEVAKRLRELPEGRDLYLVAVSGYADEKTRSHALASGCDHFLVKPVNFHVLDKLLDDASEEVARPRS